MGVKFHSACLSKTAPLLNEEKGTEETLTFGEILKKWKSHLKLQAGKEATYSGDPCDEESSDAWKKNLTPEQVANGEVTRQAIRQASQLMCASRYNYQAFFGKLLECELHTRSEEMAKPITIVSILQGIEKKTEQDSECNDCRHYRRRAIACAASAVCAPWLGRIKARAVRCMNSCYQRVADQYFNELYAPWDESENRSRKR
jgi:hypothetical protein